MVLTAMMMVALAGMVAFAVDYGFLVKVRADMQRAADAAALRAEIQRASGSLASLSMKSRSKSWLMKPARSPLAPTGDTWPPAATMGRFVSGIYKTAPPGQR